MRYHTCYQYHEQFPSRFQNTLNSIKSTNCLELLSTSMKSPFNIKYSDTAVRAEKELIAVAKSSNLYLIEFETSSKLKAKVFTTRKLLYMTNS